MWRWLVVSLALGGCRYLATPAPQVTPENPALISSGNPTDPTRQQQPAGRTCVVDCPFGSTCGPDGVCVSTTPARQRSADAGPAWLEGVGTPR